MTDLDCAIGFYEAVFGVTLERQTIDGYDMALFPAVDGSASGALARGDVYVPGKAGPVLYFDTPALEATLARAVARGAAIL